MFDNLDDPTPPSVTDTDLARIRARANDIRSSQRRTLVAAGSSAFAVVAVVGAAAVIQRHHTSDASDRFGTAADPSPTPAASVYVDATSWPDDRVGTGASPGAVESPVTVTSPLVVQSYAPGSAAASPDAATQSAARHCSTDAMRMQPNYLPAGLKPDYVSGQPEVGTPGSLAMWSWSDDPGHLSKQLVEFDVTLFCQGHAQFGVTGGDGNRVTQDITIHGQPAILWHEYKDTVVGIEFNWGGYGWVQVESLALGNGQPATHRLSDAEMLKIAESLPVA
jgi:hypothetical protein